MTVVHRNRGMLALAAIVAAACSSAPTESKGPPARLDALPRQLTVAETKVRDAANAFSFALWGKVNLAQRDKNVFISPLSASFALGMTLNGAANQTATEMRSALQYGGATLGEINSGYKSLMALLTSLDGGVQMQVANSIWYRDGFPFRQAFFDTTKAYFDATVKGLNFNDAPASLAAINGWVSGATNSKITKVLDEVRPENVMFLINAIYFKGSWRLKFDPAKTRPENFTAAGNVTQTVQMMHRLDSLAYYESATYQAADLAYGNSAFSMTVLLPKAGTDVESLAATLTPVTWQTITGGLRAAKVDLSFPKIKLSYERKLNDDLKALGMIVPFVGGAADFTQLSPAPTGNQLFIDFVKQNTFVDVNEEGTEAAAVTTVGVSLTSAPIVPVMQVNRPYIFVLRERLTGTLLFMGKIVNVP